MAKGFSASKKVSGITVDEGRWKSPALEDWADRLIRAVLKDRFLAGHRGGVFTITVRWDPLPEETSR